MWKLLSIQATNLCSFKELSWDIPQNVTTLVFGNNQDNDSQGSNGSGKSALIEAIAIALLGEPLRKVNADEIINDAADEAVIKATLSNQALNERMTIARKVSRKHPQRISIIKQTGPHDTVGEIVFQPSVAEYNAYILEQLGLSKDDILTNYILTAHKYKSFLSSPDKDKKEFINRFSNGVLVDESLEVLASDIEPVKKELDKAEKNVAYLQGTCHTYQAQLDKMQADTNVFAMQKKQKLEDIDAKIAQAHSAIRHHNRQIDIFHQDWDDIEEMEKVIDRIEESDMSVSESYKRVASVWNHDLLGEIPPYERQIQNALSKLEKTELEKETLDDVHKACIQLHQEAKENFEKISAQANLESNAEEREKIENELKELSSNYSQLSRNLSTLHSLKRQLSANISEYKQMLMGAIECPACHHRWFASSDVSLSEVESKLSECETQQSQCSQDINTASLSLLNCEDNITVHKQKINDLDAFNAQIQSQINSARRALNEAERKQNDALCRIRNIDYDIEDCRKNIERLKTALFDSIASVFDTSINNVETQIKKNENAIVVLKGSIQALEESRKQIEANTIEAAIAPILDAKKEAEMRLGEAEKEKENIENKLAILLRQQVRFEEFKTYLANTKIEALSVATNQFLEAIGSDIRVSFSGVTTLKSGKTRDKISVSLLRGGVDCGSYGKFSQGERSRCELATILALQKLVNTNCEDGKGLDLLVVDEVLDGVDENGLSNIFGTLNKLQVTSVIASHGLISESYPYRLIVTKTNGISSI